jgi:hypothetical protein
MAVGAGALSREHTAGLLGLLADDTPALEQFSIRFHNALPRTQHFRACCALTVLLQVRHPPNARVPAGR